MAENRTSPVGYEPIVRALFEDLRRPDLAKKFIPQVKDAETQAELLVEMGFPDEAQALLNKKESERSAGVGGAIRGLFNF